MKNVVSLVFMALLWLPVSSVQAECKGDPINPFTDIGWSCIFPMTIAGVSVASGNGEENPSSYDNPVCTCAVSKVTTIGLKTSFWEPKRIIDTAADAFCMVPLGASLKAANSGTLGGSWGRNSSGGKAFAQAHYYIFPAWHILNMFYDIPCLEDEGFDVAMMTEVMPQWNNEILSLLIQPESILFANPVAAIACSADAAATVVGMPIGSMYWCMGSWGSAYPLAGSITSTDFMEANAGIAARAIYLAGRLGMLWTSSDDGCYTAPNPIWRKDHYKLQVARPVRSPTCIPIGRTGMLWDAGKHDLRKDNFMWIMFEKKDCCMRF